MPDYTAVLNQIAASLERIAEAPGHPWVTWIPPLTTAFVSAFIGYWVAQRETRRKDARSKRLIFDLLRDEINLRWTGTISRDLHRIVEKAMKPLDGLRSFITVELGTDDMFIFQSLSKSFSEYHYLGPGLISEIIHGHIIIRDLIDLRSIASKGLDKYDAMGRGLAQSLAAGAASQEVNAHIDRVWTELLRQLESADTRFGGILRKLA